MRKNEPAISAKREDSIEGYWTLAGPGEGRYEEKKSVFLSRAMPVCHAAEAEAFVQKIRRQYPDARHTVYAYLTRDGNSTRYSDDGEPQETAGLPILDSLRKSGLTDVALTVTRYFGGILLGTGGLVRAYTAAASAAVENAGAVRMVLQERWNLTCDYPLWSKIEPMLGKYSFQKEKVLYEAQVCVYGMLPASSEGEFLAALREISAGKIIPVHLGQQFAPQP